GLWRAAPAVMARGGGGPARARCVGSPSLDGGARVADGSGVCAVIPPLSLIGPVMSIRRYGKKVLTTEDLLKNETFTTGMLDFLSGCVEARLNIVISGGSGSGKTTMLNTLSRFIPEEERIGTVGDTAAPPPQAA